MELCENALGVFVFLMFALLKYLTLYLSLCWTQWNRGLRLVEHGPVLSNPSQISDHCCWIWTVTNPWLSELTASLEHAVVLQLRSGLLAQKSSGGKARKKATIILFSHQIYSDVCLHCFLFCSFRKFPCQNLRSRVERIISASQHFQFSRRPVELLGCCIEQWCSKATSGNRKGVNSWTNNCLLNLPLILCMLSSLWWKQQQFASLGLLTASQQVAFCSFLYLTIYLFWRDSASHMLNKAADNL